MSRSALHNMPPGRAARGLHRLIGRMQTGAHDGATAPAGEQDPVLAPTFDADWHWRPQAWCASGAAPSRATEAAPGVALFHDCPRADLSLRHRASGSGLTLDVGRFAGSFLSLVIDLPAPALQGLGPRHVIRTALRLRTARPQKLFARINLRHGPNTAQIVRDVAFAQGPSSGAAEFDLAYTRMDSPQIACGWLDLIFEAPGDTRIDLTDLTVSRRPRALI